MKQIKLSLYLLLVMLLFGCNTSENDHSHQPAVYENIKTDIDIQIKDNYITTETQEIVLLFINNTDEEILYSDESIILEKKTDDGFVYVDKYGAGHEMATALLANDTNTLTIRVKPLSAGTYRFVFLQGFSTPKGPVYISPEFRVNE